jgi:hypothetical protein
VEIDLEQARGPVREWVAQEPVRREVRRRFARFLRAFQDEGGDYVYRQRVRDMSRSEHSMPPVFLLPGCLAADAPGVCSAWLLPPPACLAACQPAMQLYAPAGGSACL